MNLSNEFLKLMGGTKTLKKKIKTANDLIDATKQGIPYGALDAVTKNLGLQQKSLIHLLQTSSKTLERHKIRGTLSGIESDRLVRLVRVAVRAIEVFGDIQKASAWLKRENAALSGETPLKMLETEIGTAEVIDILGRIEYGVFS